MNSRAILHADTMLAVEYSRRFPDTYIGYNVDDGWAELDGYILPEELPDGTPGRMERLMRAGLADGRDHLLELARELGVTTVAGFEGRSERWAATYADWERRMKAAAGGGNA